MVSGTTRLACIECQRPVEFDACPHCDGEGRSDSGRDGCADCKGSGAVDRHGVAIDAEDVLCQPCWHAGQMSLTGDWTSM